MIYANSIAINFPHNLLHSFFLHLQVTRRESQDPEEERATQWNNSGTQDATWKIGVRKTQTRNTNIGFLHEEEINSMLRKWDLGVLFMTVRHPTDLNCPLNYLQCANFNKSKFKREFITNVTKRKKFSMWMYLYYLSST